MSRVAIIHDGTINPGGGAKVAIEAANALDADIYVGFASKDSEDWWEKRAPNKVNIMTLRETDDSRVRDALLIGDMLSLDLSDYDAIMTSGPISKWIQPRGDQHHYHYAHHPPLNVLWYDDSILNYAVKVLDRSETHSIPTIIANSELTSERFERVYNRTPDHVVHPPVAVETFDHTRMPYPRELVMVGRLEERKRPDIAVKAVTKLENELEEPPHLNVIGDGPMREELEEIAGDNIEFYGFADAITLRNNVEHAQAGIFLAKKEDFGITPIEYLAAGTPVVAVNEPNTNRQITDGENGILVEPTVTDVADAISNILDQNWDRDELAADADAYNTDRFHNEIQNIIQ